MDLKLYNDDCFNVFPLIPDKSVDAIICDLPYGTTTCKWDTILPFDKLWEQLNRIIKPNRAIVLFGSEPFSSALRMSNINNYKYDWTWEKERPSNFASAKHQPLRYLENICVFERNGNKVNYNPQMTIGKKNNSVGKGIRNKINESNLPSSMSSYQNNPQSNMKYPKNILKFTRGVSQIHPTQKPIELMEYLIKTYTNENETVLDFAMGSGTTMLACKTLNRNGIGIEKEREYFNIAQNRVSENKFSNDVKPCECVNQFFGYKICQHDCQIIYDTP